jgi:hypothetical protein
MASISLGPGPLARIRGMNSSAVASRPPGVQSPFLRLCVFNELAAFSEEKNDGPLAYTGAAAGAGGGIIRSMA